MPWKPWRGIEWCAFYPDITYRVNTLVKGYRAILSFKVFAAELGEWNSNSINKAQMEAFVQSLLALNTPVGILLKSYNREGVSGCDKFLLDTLENHGVQVHLTPVLIHFSGEAPDLEETTTRSNVYIVTDKALEHVRTGLSGAKAKKKYNKDCGANEIVFLDGHGSKTDHLWQHEANEEIGEKKRQRSYSEKSVYIRSALIAGSQKA